MLSRTRMLTWSALAPALLAAAMYVGCGSSSSGDQNTDNDPAEAVPGELLVGVRASLADQAGLETKIASVADVTSVKDSVYRIQLHAGVTQEQAVGQLVHADILYIEPNYVVHVYAAPPDDYWTATAGPQYGAALKGEMESAWAAATSDGTYTTGSPLKVALLDTGVRVSSAQFGASAAKLSLAAAKNEITGVTYALDATAIADDNGHGTACASIIVGAPGTTIGSGTGMVGVTSWNNTTDPKIVTVIPFKVLDANGKGNHAIIAQGVTDAIAAGAKIISMSFGGAAPSWTMQNAIQQAKAAGVLVIAAAGNDGKSVMRYPAAYQTAAQMVLSVGSTDNTDTLSPDSNYGTWVNVLAPGAAINIAGSSPAVGLWAADSTADGALTQTMSGTSLSTAFVSGVAALAWAKNHSMTAADIRALITTSVDSFDRATGKSIAVGAGRINPATVLANTASPFSRVLGAITFLGVSMPSGKGAIAGTVTVTSAQGSDTTITLASNNAAVAVPGTVKVLAGKLSATFTATIGSVASDTTVTITGTNGSETTTAKLLVAQPAIAAVTLAASTIAGGASTTGRVVLNTAPPKGSNLVVTLSADSAAVHFAATTVTVAGGSTTGGFSVTTDAVASSTPVTITGTDANGRHAAVVLTLTSPVISNFTLAKASITFGTTTGTVILNAKAPTGGKVVTLASSDGLVSVPSSVTVPAGTTSATFTVTPEASTVLTTVTITATTGSVSKTATIKVNPPLATLAVGTATITGAGTTTATVTLSDSAPSAIQVGITSNQARVTLSGSAVSGASPNQVVTVAQGAKTATFTVNVAAGNTTVAAVVAATYQGVTVSKTITSAAPTLSAFTCPSTASSGNTITCTVTLSASAPVAMDVGVATSSATYLPAPAGGIVTVASGSTSNIFTVTAGTPGSATSYTFTATMNGSTKTASIRISPSGVTLASVALDFAARVGGLQAGIGTVTLSGNAPTGGINVALSSAQLTGATVPSSVTVSSGTTTATFAVTTLARVAALGPFNISAAYSGTTRTAPLTVNPTITTVAPAAIVTIAYGATSAGNTVTLAAGNSTGSALGLTATLVDAADTSAACADTASTVAAAVPPLAVAAAATNSNAYTVTNHNVTGSAATCKVKATATIAGVAVSAYSATITLTSIGLTAVALDFASRVGGLQTATGTVTLSGNAPTGGTTVTLSSDQVGAATVPANVVVSAGATTATFTVTTLAQGASVGPFNINGTLSGTTHSAPLTVTPTIIAVTPAAPAAIASGFTNAANTVTLGAINGTGSPLAVATTLVDASNTALPCADTDSTVAAAAAPLVVASAGTASNDFTVTNNNVGSTATCKVKASVTIGSVTASAYSSTITLTTLSLSSVALDFASRVGGLQTATGTVTLSGNAPTGGTTVTLSSDQVGAATVPANVVVSAGASTATFTVTTLAQSASVGPFNINGTLGSTTHSAPLTVTPTIIAVTPAAPAAIVEGYTDAGNTVTLGASNGTGSPLAVTTTLVDASNTANSCADAASTVAAASAPLVVASAGTASNVFTVTNNNVGSAATCKVKASVTIGGVIASAYSATITLAAPPALVSVGLDNATRVGGLETATGTVTISADAPPSGVLVTLSSGSPAATVPINVTVAPNSTTATFTVTTVAQTAAVGPFNISATYSGVTHTTLLRVDPTINSVTPSAPAVIANSDALTGNQVTLAADNLTGSPLAVAVSLVDASSVGDPCADGASTVAAVDLPLEVTSTASNFFTVTNHNAGPTAICKVKASVTVGSVIVDAYSAPITLDAAPVLLSVGLDKSSLAGGLENATGTVTLSSLAPAGGVIVALSSDQTDAADVPAHVTVAAGSTTATFTVTSYTQIAPVGPFLINASYNEIPQSVSLTVNPPIASVGPTTSPEPILFGASSIGNVVTLGAANSTGSALDLTVELVNADASGPCADAASFVSVDVATLQVGTGLTASNTYTIGNNNVTGSTASCKVHVATVVGGITVDAYSAVFDLVSGVIPALSELSVGNHSPQGGLEHRTGTVVLDGVVPASGLTVYLRSSDPSAIVPDSVAIPGGTNTANFTLTTLAVTELTGPITIDASLAADFGTGVISDTNLFVNPITLTVTPGPDVTLSAAGTSTATDLVVMVGGFGTNDTGAPVTIVLRLVDAGDHGMDCLGGTVDSSVTIAAGAGTSSTYTVTDTNLLGPTPLTCQVKATLTINGIDAFNYSAPITLDL